MTKYGNKITFVDGRSFSSKLEAATYQMLKLFEKAGEYRDVKCQVSVYLTAARVHMIPDFSAVNCKTGELEYFEAKGAQTQSYRNKRKLWTKFGPGKLHVYVGNYRKLRLLETVVPNIDDESTCLYCGRASK